MIRFHFIGDGMEAQRGYGPNVAQLVAMLGVKNKDQVGNCWECVAEPQLLGKMGC